MTSTLRAVRPRRPLPGAGAARWPGRGTDAVLALGLAALAAVPASSAIGVVLGELHGHGPVAAEGAVALAQSLPLAVRRRWPGAVLGVVGGAFAAHELLGYPTSAAGLGLYAALYSAGAHLARYRKTTLTLGCAAYAALAVGLHLAGSPASGVELVTFAPVLALFAAAGTWVRARRASTRAAHAAQSAQSVAQERSRIARELHDVVTHHVTAMVVQAEALQIVLGQRAPEVTEGLSAVSETGRDAMSDLRDLLDALHDTGDPSRGDGHDVQHSSTTSLTTCAPAVGRLDDLVERSRRSGLTIELTQTGSDDAVLPTGVRLAVHRVVQEALTNAFKHAPQAATLVAVEQRPDEIRVQIVTTPAPLRAPRAWVRSGRGLVGLRERVAFVGGQLAAGPEPDGGFAVRAQIPLHHLHPLRGGDRG